MARRLNKSPEARERARELRSNMSISEKVFWRLVRKDVLGHRFRRQVPMGPYVLDFYVPSAKLCVEIDGEQHRERTRQDGARDDFLASLGIVTLRIPSLDIFDSDPRKLTHWMKELERLLAERSSGFPPFRSGEREG